ncbi:MAG: hypothetical protein OIF56_10840, partial [Cohaesibacter sp.]|nr:hypothetical protein [Cohaesibacter sp.]
QKEQASGKGCCGQGWLVHGGYPLNFLSVLCNTNGIKGRFYWLPGLRRSCFVVNQTMAAKASYQKANKIRSYGVIFRAVGIIDRRDLWRRDSTAIATKWQECGVIVDL